MLYIEYANLKTRGISAAGTRPLPSIFLNNVDISNQSYEDFNPFKYRDLILPNNNIKILVHES
jgi:hypothetical protein